MGFHYARNHDLAGFGGEICELAHRVHREAALLPPTPIADLQKALDVGPSQRLLRQVAYPMESILEDISAAVTNIDAPTVLLADELDQVDSIERHEAEVLAYLPNAEFKIIKGSCHLVPIDEPVQLAKEIASF